jgi:TrpR family transcriptional regulator, trp operon repressor
MKYHDNYGKELESLLRKAAKSPELLHEFLYDLLSKTEYQDLGVRWQIVKMLEQGAPQRNIAKHLGVSIATVTRGSKEMLNKRGGFRRLLGKHYRALKVKKPSS